MKKMTKFQWIVTAICVVLMFFNKFFPPLFGLNALGTSIVCIFVATLAMMLLVSLTWSLPLSVLAFTVSGVYSMNESLSNFLGNNIFWFMIFSGTMIATVIESGLLRRIAVWFITRPFTKKSPWLFVGMLFLSVLLIGCIIDVTALTILFTALTAEILEILNVKKGERFGESIMIGVLVLIGMSYGISPIGHPVPIISMEILGGGNFLHYLITGLTVGLVFFAILMLMMRFIFKLDVDRVKSFDADALISKVGAFTKKEKLCTVVLISLIVLWILPSLVADLLPEFSAWLNQFGIIGPLIAANIAMCLIHCDGKPLMDLGQNLPKAPWVGGFTGASAIGLSTALNHPDAHISEAIYNALSPAFSSMAPFVFVIIICTFCAVMTNFSSDTVTIMLSASIAATLINSGAIPNVNPGALSIALGICACCAYATPPGSVYAAIVTGTGWVRVKRQFVEAGSCAIICAICASFIGYNLACLLLK